MLGMNRIFRVLLLILGLALVPLSHAEDLVVSRAVFEDATGALSIADVVQREFAPVGPKLFKGFTVGALVACDGEGARDRE